MEVVLDKVQLAGLAWQDLYKKGAYHVCQQASWQIVQSQGGIYPKSSESPSESPVCAARLWAAF